MSEGWKDIYDMKGALSIAINGGSAFHLWFLPLAMSLVLVIALLARLGLALIGLLLVFPALVGLVFGPCRAVIGSPGAEARGGFLFAPGFVLLGWVVNEWRLTMTPRSRSVGAIMVIAGLLVEIMEATLIAAYGGGSADTMYLSGPSVAFGAFLFFASYSKSTGFLSFIGRISLGIYCSHLAFFRVVSTYLPPTNIPYAL